MKDNANDIDSYLGLCLNIPTVERVAFFYDFSIVPFIKPFR